MASESVPMYCSTFCPTTHVGCASTTGPVCPPMSRHNAIHCPNDTTGPTASKVPVRPCSAESTIQPARSRTSTTEVGRSGVSGTSIGSSGARAARATQYPDRPVVSPGPPIKPARAIRNHQGRAVRHLSTLAAGQAGHPVPAIQCLARDLPAQPRRTAKDQNVHGTSQPAVRPDAYRVRSGRTRRVDPLDDSGSLMTMDGDQRAEALPHGGGRVVAVPAQRGRAVRELDALRDHAGPADTGHVDVPEQPEPPRVHRGVTSHRRSPGNGLLGPPTVLSGSGSVVMRRPVNRRDIASA